MEFRHHAPGFGRLGVSGLPDPRRGASTLSTCRMASLRRLGPLPPFPGSLVKAPLAYLLVPNMEPYNPDKTWQTPDDEWLAEAISAE
jgi:hypothetical protein